MISPILSVHYLVPWPSCLWCDPVWRLRRARTPERSAGRAQHRPQFAFKICNKTGNGGFLLLYPTAVLISWVYSPSHKTRWWWGRGERRRSPTLWLWTNRCILATLSVQLGIERDSDVCLSVFDILVERKSLQQMWKSLWMFTAVKAHKGS